MENNNKDTNTQKTNGTSSNGADQVVIIEEKISKVNGDIAIRRYTRGKMLGKGGFAKCYEVTNLETKKTQAAKIIAKNTLTKSRARQKLISEIKIHKSLHHSNVVQFEHVFEDHENVYILLEICTNQTLNELIKRRKRLMEIEVQSYLMQIITALKYLHANRVIHRDLKLGNLFLNEKMELKLADFGLATKLEFDGEKKRTICGTPNYIAPEILDGKTGHSYEVDIWSLGVIIYALLVGKPPFETPDVKTTYKKIKMNNYTFPEHVPLSDAAKNLIQKILILEPTKRPTLDEILAHPFLNPVGVTIPKLLQVAFISGPPPSSWLKQFMPQGNPMRVSQGPLKLAETQPIATTTLNTENGFEKKLMGNTAYPANSSTNNFNTTGFKDRPGTQKSLHNMKTLPNMQSSTGVLSSMPLLKQQSKSITGFNKQEIWVKKWVDYSSKYGLGYLLSNGSTGVFFNDSTKIVLEPKGTYFEYMEKRTTDKQDIISQHTLTDYPKELSKKVTLVLHFRSYLEGDVKQDEFSKEEENKGQNMVYVKKWMKTRHAILFRLSNKIVQVNFTDKTEIILSSEQKTVTYVNKKGERSNYPLQTALDSPNTEMSKRLKYTREILTHMLNNNNNAANTANLNNPTSKE